MITFTSSSTVRNFVEAIRSVREDWRSLIAPAQIACIGPITARTAGSSASGGCRGVRYTIDGLVDAVIRLPHRTFSEEDPDELLSAPSSAAPKQSHCSMVRETRLDVTDLIAPLFVVEGKRVREEVPSMPGCSTFRWTGWRRNCQLVDLGIPAVIVFGVPSKKDAVGSRLLGARHCSTGRPPHQELHPDLCVIADTCLCPVYGSRPLRRGEGRRDRQRRVLGIVGADGGFPGAGRGRIIAPSNMMDGFVRAIQQGLDEAGFEYRRFFPMR